MKNYSSQINRIKDTLGEIKNNIKKFQRVNIIFHYIIIFQSKGKTITKKTFKRKYKSFIKKRNTLNDENNIDSDINEKDFKTQKVNKAILDQFNISSISNNDILYRNQNENISIDNDDIILNYKIEKIQQEINEIKEQNDSLLKNLKKEKEKNIFLNNSPDEKDIENALLEISKYIEVSNYDEIPQKLLEMINYLKSLNDNNEKGSNKEFISNLKKIYIKENNLNDKNNNNINMKILWRWIKCLISNNTNLKNDISKNANILQNIERKNIFYKQSCEEIINSYGYTNINKFDEFIHNLLNKNDINKKRMEQLKKMLDDDCNKNKK